MRIRQRLLRSSQWRFRRATARFRALPDFLVIGAQKAGTTSLHRHLTSHPSVLGTLRKEAHFFDSHFARGELWYRANFPFERRMVGGCVSGDFTPQYLGHPKAAERAGETVPDANLVALLRHPVDRAYSSWRWAVNRGWEDRSFQQAIEEEPDRDAMESLDWANHSSSNVKALKRGYKWKSRYADHLARWFRHYSRDQVLVVQAEKLFTDPEASLQKTWDHIGVPSWRPETFPHANANHGEPMDATLRAQLDDYFSPLNRDLERLTGIEFDW